MSNRQSSTKGRSNASSSSEKETSLQNIHPNPAMQSTGSSQGSDPDPAAVAASVQTLDGMASTLGVGVAENVAERLALVPDSNVPEELADVAIEGATKHPELVEKFFDVARMKSQRTSILGLEEVASSARGFVKAIEDDILRR